MNRITSERLGVFGDAVIAIILTVMALELPVEIKDGVVQFEPLFKGIGVYAVSFCFVASIWIQHAMLFSQKETLNNNIIVNDLILIFFISLMPTVTNVMFTDIEQKTVVLFGVLFTIINTLFYHLRFEMAKLREQEHDFSEKIVDAYNHVFLRHGLFQFGLNVLAVIVAWFSYQIALVLYVGFTLWEFFQNNRERKNLDDIFQMPVELQQRFFSLNDDNRKAFCGRLNKCLASSEKRGDQAKWMQTMKEEYDLTDQEVVFWMRHGRRMLNFLNAQ